jgi:hypothetical protein
MKQLDNELEINASAERVWQLLTDFASFPQWNPFIQHVSGELKRGAQLEVTLRPSGTHATTIRPTVLKAEPNSELRWIGRWLLPGLLDDEHILPSSRSTRTVCASHNAKSSRDYSLLSMVAAAIPTRDVASERWARRSSCVPNKRKLLKGKGTARCRTTLRPKRNEQITRAIIPR